MPINSLHDAIAALVPADGRYEDCGRRIIARLDRLWETLDAEALRDELVFWHGLSRGQATDVLELYADARLRTDYDLQLAASGDTAAYHASIKAAEVSARLASKRYARPKAIPDLSGSPLFGGPKQLNLLGEEI